MYSPNVDFLLGAFLFFSVWGWLPLLLLVAAVVGPGAPNGLLLAISLPWLAGIAFVYWLVGRKNTHY